MFLFLVSCFHFLFNSTPPPAHTYKIMLQKKIDKELIGIVK